MQRLHVHRRVCRCGLLQSEHAGSAIEELGLPRGDLAGMHIGVLCQVGQGLLALNAGRATLALEAGE
jgi:hypothetical protein